jgi:hypothetical protein
LSIGVPMIAQGVQASTAWLFTLLLLPAIEQT